MIRAVVICALLGVCFASYGKYTRKCFQCEYVPKMTYTTTVYDTQEYEVKTPVTTVMCKYGYSYRGPTKEYKDGYNSDYKEYDPGYMAENNPADCMENTVYETEVRTRKVPRTVTKTKPAGGFAPCKGGITAYSAKADGVDAWDCHTNCYVRTDKTGRVTRGCYKHEYNVDQNLLGCHEQDGASYCFCDGDHCNGH